MTIAAFSGIKTGMLVLLLLFLLGPAARAQDDALSAETADVGGKKSSLSSLWSREIPMSRSLAKSDMASYLEDNKSNSRVASNLATLLQNHDLSTRDLANMIVGTQTPTNPLDSNNEKNLFTSENDPNYWKAQVVTPVKQGVDGQLVQAVLFTNEFRNPENPQRVLSFGGVQIPDYNQDKALPDGACLEASYSFKETQAEGTWQMLCMHSGYKFPNMTEWAAQAEHLVASTNATFLTGFKQGCEIAKSEGLLHPHLPVVCWGATGTLTPSWIDAYPGLAKAIGKKSKENNDYMIEPIASKSVEENVIDPIAANSTDTEKTAMPQTMSGSSRSANADMSTSYKPQNHNIYVIQTFTDPSSNCLLPPEAPGTGLANVCAYPSGSRCDPVNGAPRFDYSIFSRCSDMASLPMLLETNLPVTFDENSCISQEDVGSDESLRDCPFHDIAESISSVKNPYDWGVKSTEVKIDSMAATNFSALRFSALISVLVTSMFLMQ